MEVTEGMGRDKEKMFLWGFGTPYRISILALFRPWFFGSQN